MLSYRKLKIGCSENRKCWSACYFGTCYSFLAVLVLHLTKKNENGFGFLDFLPWPRDFQFLCAWAWGEHVVLELKLYFEDIIYLRKNRSRAIHLWKGIIVYFEQFILSYDGQWRFLCTMIRPPYCWIAAKSGAYISIECVFFSLTSARRKSCALPVALTSL